MNPKSIHLNPSEWHVMEFLWAHGPATGRQAADHPQQGPVDAVAVKDEDTRNDGPQKGRHGDAGRMMRTGMMPSFQAGDK